MKNKLTLSAFLTLLFLFTTFSFAWGQHVVPEKKFSPYWEVGLTGGTSLFFGDVKQNPILPVSTNNNEWRLGGSLLAGRQFSYVFGLRGQALYGQIAGTKRSADYFFEGDYFEFNLNTTIDLNNLLGRKRTDRFITTYLLAGVGLTNYNSTIYTLSTGMVKRKIGFGNGSGIGGRTLEGILTGGIGVNFRINDHFIINLETANRIMNSDEMDGWVRNFKYDVYNYTSVGLFYKFGQRKAKTAPPASVVTHQNMREIPPAQPVHQPEKKPCITEPTPVMPPTTTNTTKKVEKTPVQTEQPAQQPAVVPVKVSTPAPPPQPVLEYRVQIRAKYGNPISVSWLSRRYHIPVNEIRQDKHNGYYIYTVGSYDTYEQARTRRDQLRNVNGIRDAFVVAFKNGYRLDKLP
ncbi:SPOR domain-containing protein [Candidatus Sulfidibacterium hydrothermale]|uniref:SPOR domain-containing protein n=1 Tax=Candidatus Sulfidibacterium hydrothermale TaxID=2875962 RepID=UPI001F0B13EA|nr:SPOR domain-containing protein [Candidatus Sulfidibacterium hydrothermale]UBM62798.1 SPOR domain-containing protein [Candidatus Sulfidibacterium hydrothermale]